MTKLDIAQIIMASGLGSGAAVFGLLKIMLKNMRDDIKSAHGRIDAHLQGHK